MLVALIAARRATPSDRSNRALSGARGAARGWYPIVMLTGDNRLAMAVAAKLGIDQVEAEILPEQKSAVVRRLASKPARSPWPATG
jgi:Cu+-exporting ATPase